MSEPPEAFGEAFRWLGEATEELDTARHIQSNPELPARMPCFLAHLAAEKALKALLISAYTPFPKTHDLVRLYSLVPEDQRPSLEVTDLAELNPWAIDGRYTVHTADTSYEVAAALVTKTEQILRTIQEHIERATILDASHSDSDDG